MDTQDGGVINVWTKSERADAQQWIYEDGAIKLAADKKFCLNLHCGKKENGATVNLWTYKGDPSQKWDICGDRIKYHDDNKWVLNLHCMKLEDGGEVNLWEDNGGESQGWATAWSQKESTEEDWWKPDADCDGAKAEERAKWLVDNKGMSMDDAKKQVREEFPSAFGATGKGAGKGYGPGQGQGPHYVDCKFPHTLSVEETGDGPKLKFVVTPRNPEQVSLMAFHYVINDGASMNFDVTNAENNSYVHQTPGGSYPTCPRGAKVSYWLCGKVNGLLDEEPAGACPHPDRRLYWTAA